MVIVVVVIVVVAVVVDRRRPRVSGTCPVTKPIVSVHGTNIFLKSHTTIT